MALSPALKHRALQRVAAVVRVTAEDAHAGLPEPGALIDGVPDLDLDDPAGFDVPPEEKIAVARRGEAAVPYELLGINPPRDLAWKRLER